jgi:hypothetical protein
MRLLLLCLILQIIGGQYFLVQMVAWSQMIATYSKTTSLTEALKETFDGQHPCDLCKSIEKAKQTEKKPETVAVNLKQDYFCEINSVIILTPPLHSWSQTELVQDSHLLSEPPPTPPPRSLLG